MDDVVEKRAADDTGVAACLRRRKVVDGDVDVMVGAFDIVDRNDKDGFPPWITLNDAKERTM